VTVALTAHSTALGIRSVNPLNPRALVFDGVPREPYARRRFVAAGFTRGEPIVELATRDETTQALRFFVLAFTRACDLTATCTAADTLTEDTERNWKAVELYEDVDLENTALDCLRCHQPQGPGTPRLLRMQELRFPWTHFLAPASETVSGGQLVDDYFSAHVDTERYGAIPAGLIRQSSDPAVLSQLLAQEDSATQPNEFPGFVINLELQSTGASPTYDALVAGARAGQFIPVPWKELRVTDTTAQSALAAKFKQALISGPRTDVPDVRHLMTEEVERATQVRPSAGATGAALLMESCGQCHQPARNQALTRARFDVTRLGALTAEERALALDRVQRPPEDVLVMPPPFVGVLTDEERTRVLEALR